MKDLLYLQKACVALLCKYLPIRFCDLVDQILITYAHGHIAEDPCVFGDRHKVIGGREQDCATFLPHEGEILAVGVGVANEEVEDEQPYELELIAIGVAGVPADSLYYIADRRTGRILISLVRAMFMPKP